MKMKHITAIFKKQIKDTFKNKTVLIQFLMFPILSVIMSFSITSKNLPDNFFVTLFATMFIGMAPMTSIASIISEEKEKNTLRVLMMANVKPLEYLIGVGTYILVLCALGAVVFGLVGAYTGERLLRFIIVMVIGILASMLLGAALGMLSKNQMSASSLTVPIMIVFSFLPMIAMFNTSIEKVSKIIYTQQIYYLINNLSVSNFNAVKFIIIGANIIVFYSVFIFAYKKKGLALD